MDQILSFEKILEKMKMKIQMKIQMKMWEKEESLMKKMLWVMKKVL